MPFFKRHAKCLLLLLVFGTGILITAPYARLQGPLAQGDHGRDLYAAQAVLRGELPYKDFWWVYGPLMPYYYGLFYKIFGIKISSILLGKLLLKILGGILMCLAMMATSSWIVAYLAACWFMIMASDFFFTYNHIGGIVMLLGVVFCLLSYIQKSRPAAAWGALAFILLLSLIKINFGLTALAMCVLTVAVNDGVNRRTLNTAKKIFYTFALIGIPFLVYAIYWSLLKSLSAMEIRQCLPYIEGDQPYNISPWVATITFLQITYRNATSTWWNLALAVLINVSFLRSIYLFAKNKLPFARKITLGLSLGFLGLFCLINFHEYLKSGVWYRGFWAQPLSMMLFFLLVDIAAQSVPKILRKIVFLSLAILVVTPWLSALPSLKAIKTESQYLSLPRAGVYVINAPAWIITVTETTDFLNKTLKPDELFFALPYDCLYYFLTDRKSPTRQLIFFEHIKIPLEQEKSVIAELQKNNVRYIVISSRAWARQELGLGLLGQTYCPLIGKYIDDNFEPLARFGDWTNEPGWAWNHGTLILKRKK